MNYEQEHEVSFDRIKKKVSNRKNERGEKQREKEGLVHSLQGPNKAL